MKSVSITNNVGNSITLTVDEYGSVSDTLELILDALRASGYPEELIQDEIRYFLSEEDFLKLQEEQQCCKKK